MDIDKVVRKNINVKLGSLVGVIFLISLVSYTAAYSRRILVPKYDERMIIILESSLIFLITLLFVFITNFSGNKIIPSSNKSIISCFKEFKMEDFKTVLLGSFSGAFIAIFWIYIIRYNELSKLLLTKQSLDIIFALGGSYLLLREQITIKKFVAFILLINSVYLLSN